MSKHKGAYLLFMQYWINIKKNILKENINKEK